MSRFQKYFSHKEIDSTEHKTSSKVNLNVKDSGKRMRRQATDWKEYLQNTYLEKDCYPKYTKNFSKLNNKKTKNLIKK